MSSFPIGSPDQLARGKLLRWLPWIAGILAIGLILGCVAIFRTQPINERPDAWGQFGDYMGGLLNPLIFLFTLIVAVKVWNLQKTEVMETRKALEDQGKTAEQQRREQRFFDFLSIYRSTVESIKFEIPTESGALTVLRGTLQWIEREFSSQQRTSYAD